MTLSGARPRWWDVAATGEHGGLQNVADGEEEMTGAELEARGQRICTEYARGLRCHGEHNASGYEGVSRP